MEALGGDDFTFVADGCLVDRGDVMPPITPTDRVGVVMGTGSEGLGAGTFVLASVLAFYDGLDPDRPEGVDYPEFYTIQTTADPADFRMLDVYPSHKNVSVAPESQRLVETIVDRGIDILLVPDGPTDPPEIRATTRRSAARTVEHCFVYASDGRPSPAAFEIRVPASPVRDWFQSTVESMADPQNRSLPSFGDNAAPVRQGFRPTDLADAMTMLPRIVAPT